ncbi:hypothetical protein ACFVS2_25580 [Brevibacillus sp. NPDC058079]|uniref:hypothetical protein n=1 Tax=Brevibacillus sp. NPDC058079 TaxID=3346330 RepID=UPI0036E14B6A
MTKDLVMDVTQKVIDVIQCYRNDVVVITSRSFVSPKTIMYTYGSKDEFREMIAQLEEDLQINIESDDIGEMTVRTFIDLVIKKAQESRNN